MPYCHETMVTPLSEKGVCVYNHLWSHELCPVILYGLGIPHHMDYIVHTFPFKNLKEWMYTFPIKNYCSSPLTCRQAGQIKALACSLVNYHNLAHIQYYSIFLGVSEC